MAIKLANFEFVAWGRYEANDSSGREHFYWGAEELRWKLPAVVALFPR